MVKYIIFGALVFMIAFQQVLIEEYDRINEELQVVNDKLMAACQYKNTPLPESDLNERYYD